MKESKNELATIPDPAIERLLIEEGVEVSVQTVELDLVDIAKSKRNHGRITPIQAGVIEEYAEAMKRGDSFRMSLYNLNKGVYDIIDGCHRHEAAMTSGKSQQRGYVIRVDEMTAMRIAMRCNQLNGVRTSKADQISQAVKLVRTYGVAVDRAARQMGLARTTVATGVYVAEARDKMMTEWGIDSSRVLALPDSAVVKIFQLEHLPQVMRSAAELATKRQLDGVEVAALVHELNSLGTEAEKLQCLEQKKTVKRQPKAIERPNRAFLLRTLATILSFEKRLPTRQMLQLTNEDVESGECLKLLVKAEGELQRVKKLLLSSGK